MDRLRIAVAVLASVLVLAPLLPRQLGGDKAYVITYGVSMEPGIVAGDLVITQAQQGYVIGETIAYESTVLTDRTVLHRIIAETSDGFVTQGDNNSWLDPDRPTASDIYGKQWIHIPQGGIWLKRLASPAVVGGIAFFILWWSTSVSAVHRPRRRRRQTMGVVPHKPHAAR